MKLGFRVVQFTHPGSGCSVQFGTKITCAPGNARRTGPSGMLRTQRRSRPGEELPQSNEYEVIIHAIRNVREHRFSEGD
jgi:hypothetical protein